MRVALLLLLAASARAVTWNAISCPNGGSCSYQNTGSADEAVSLFFQVELGSGQTQGSFTCSGGGMIYCSRTWMAVDSGSAGDCFFLLPAGGSFQCQTQGTVNFIGAHASPLTGSLLSSTVQQVPCAGGSCTYTNNGATDLWVAQAVDTSGAGHNTFRCTYQNAGATLALCNYAVNGTGAYSCGYILPAGASMKCAATGSVSVRGSAAVAFKAAYLSGGAAVETAWNCPLVTYPKPNMCDCGYTNPHSDKDLVVMVTASSTDEDFNSFHCGYDGVNVCSWGSNTNDLGNGGGCYFILPPSTDFTCEMEWGAASFSVSTALLAGGSLFPTSEKAAKREWKRPATTEEPVDHKLQPGAQRALFESWKAHHGKVYASPLEEEQRFGNFRKHLSVFLKHQKDGSKLMPNKLADWSKAEFEGHLRDCSKPMKGGEVPHLPRELAITAEDVANIPDSVDWRTKGMVTPVKDQGQCGSCWSFSTTGAIEGAWAMAGNQLQSLSEQELVSCDTNCYGCDGGWPYLAIQYVQEHGDATEESYPYVSGNGNAPACSSGHTMADVKVTGYYMVDNNEDAMAAAVAKYGPMSISLDAMTQLWWPYTGGIMTGCCNTAPDHAVLIVGYGVENGTKYWLIKNSWGTSWGEDGYIRLERGTNQCGITSAPVLAFVQGGQPIPSPSCPPETVVTNNTDGSQTCEWRNNTNGVVFPPPATLSPDCGYWPMEQSFSYIWDGKAADPAKYPCPPSAQHQQQGTEEYCVFFNGMNGLHVPATATLNCSSLASGGWFSYTFMP